ncbi:LysR family transcriptional regulator [Pseudomonas sp. GM50]|uniref:LysR family transcriptional regulator n=1 Tax=Pseudomonas sp. GM50 TaxID=1144332 RepID=UPI000518D8FD
MRFSFRQVEIFWAIMTTGSVTKAAALLKTSQPTVSREIARFEHVLGLKLFERTQARLQPTAQGLSLFEEVKTSYYGLERIHNAAQSIKNFQTSLSIACLPAFSQSLLPYVCGRFINAYPDVNINITPQESPLLEEWMTAQRHDFGLTENSETPAGTRCENVFTGDEVCVLPPNHPLCSKKVITPQDLAGINMVSLSGQDPYRIILDRILTDAQVKCRTVIETHSAAAVCFFVQQNVGVGIINPLTALSFADQTVCMRRFSVSIPFSINLVTPLYRPQTSVATSFINELKLCADDLHQQLRTLLA